MRKQTLSLAAVAAGAALALSACGGAEAGPRLELTAAGRQAAIAAIRRHRIVERFLAEENERRGRGDS